MTKTIWSMILFGAASLSGQGLDSSLLLQRSTGDVWPTYNGDYSGRRFSSLVQINRSNITSLTLAWAFQTHSTTLKCTPLVVNGVAYVTVPDHVWALDART